MVALSPSSPAPPQGPHSPWSGQPTGWVPPPPPPGAWHPALAPAAPNGQPLAGFADRLLAYLIDGALGSVVSLVIMVPLMFVWVSRLMAQVQAQPDVYGDPSHQPTLGEMWSVVGPLMGVFALAMGLSVLFAYTYYVEYQYRKGGQTLGKKAMKIRVVPVDPAGTLTRGALTKRWGVERLLGTCVPLFVYLDGFWQLWDKPLQQCLHDKAAQTVVVKVG
ncbi:RDD family protein [Catellatospora sp. NPDC049609]|uniref:RDD family protein n=1 Tax=Catellatospora sp. NPDC049609 TaxID=3155505 RepID=UPI00342ACA9A